MPSKIKTATWLDREGQHADVRIRGGHLGRRVSIIRWIDTGEVVCREIEGDGRKPGFVLHASRTFNGGNLPSIIASIQAEVEKTGAVDLNRIVP